MLLLSVSGTFRTYDLPNSTASDRLTVELARDDTQGPDC